VCSSDLSPGASRREQVEENMKALEVSHRLTPEIMNKIDEVLGNKPRPEKSWRDL